MEWGTSRRDKCIFWLNGMAGTGRSTIARTVARAFYDQGRLGASFFFSRGRRDLVEADNFFSHPCPPAFKSVERSRIVHDRPTLGSRNGVPLQMLGGHLGSVRTLGFSLDGRVLAAGSGE